MGRPKSVEITAVGVVVTSALDHPAARRKSAERVVAQVASAALDLVGFLQTECSTIF